MRFSHHPAIWSRFPELAAGALFAGNIRPDVDATPAITRYEQLARQRLEQAGSESELPEIQAWRRAFQRMGLKPTQYRCASESLLRRFKKEGSAAADTSVDRSLQRDLDRFRNSGRSIRRRPDR